MAEQSITELGKKPVKTVLSLSVPAIAEQLLTSLAGLIDTAMVGSIGAAATASIAINISTIWLIDGFITASSAGSMFLVARSLGEGNKIMAKRITRQSITVAVILGLILSLITLAVSGSLPYWLGAEKDVIPLAITYMRIYGFTFIFQAIAVTISSIFRAAGNTKTPFLINAAANIANIIGNFLLIYPTRSVFGMSVFGAGLGVEGAALSTLISKILAAIFLLIFIVRMNSPVKISIKGDYRVSISNLKKLLAIGIPVAAERSTLSIGQVALTGIVSRLGTVALAAHYLTNNIESLLYLPAYGFASTATALVGQSLGADNYSLADKFAGLILKINSIFILSICVPMFIVSPFVLGLFSPDPNVISLGTITFRMTLVTEVFFTISVVASGICRGAGDVKFSLWVSIIGMWVIRIGLAYVMAYPFGLGLIGIWIAVGIDIFIRGILFILRINSGKWKYIWR
ncbi:MATE family efflux transporter [Anaerotignum faecicola]|nr:MATE family efflux transporter [Anaerotignum faecicola]